MAGPPSGIAAQFGMVDEPSYGTRTTVTRFHEFTEEDVELDWPRLESRGLRPGSRILRSYQWKPGSKLPGGDVTYELGNKGWGLLLKHVFGSVATSQPDVGGNPTVYDHAYVIGDLTGKSFTGQFGRPDDTGTVQPFTYSGCKVGKAEFSAKVDDWLHLKLSLLAQDEDTATTLAAASYPSGYEIFTFDQGTLSIAGTPIDVAEFTWTLDNQLSDDRKRLGSRVRKEPLEKDLRVPTGEITAYFDNLTAYNRFVAGTEASLVLDFLGSTISTTYKYELKITLNVRFDGKTPTVGGREELMQSLAIKAVDPGSGGVTLLYRTTDTTP